MTRTRVVAQVAAWLAVALLAPVPQNQNQALAASLLNWIGQLIQNPGQVGQLIQAVSDWADQLAAFNRRMLNGDGPFAPATATAVLAVGLLAFVLYWYSRSHDRLQASAVERLIGAAGPVLLAALAFASPGVAFALCGLHVLFERVNPPRRHYVLVPV